MIVLVFLICGFFVGLEYGAMDFGKLIEKGATAVFVAVGLPVLFCLALVVCTWWTHPERTRFRPYYLGLLGLAQSIKSIFTDRRTAR